jgi:hypothetical protein
VASGLQVQGTLGAADLRVQAGIAIDRKGNLIVLSTGGSGLLGDVPPLTAHFGDCERRFHTMVSAHFI